MGANLLQIKANSAMKLLWQNKFVNVTLALGQVDFDSQNCQLHIKELTTPCGTSRLFWAQGTNHPDKTHL